MHGDRVPDQGVAHHEVGDAGALQGVGREREVGLDDVPGGLPLQGAAQLPAVADETAHALEEPCLQGLRPAAADRAGRGRGGGGHAAVRPADQVVQGLPFGLGDAAAAAVPVGDEFGEDVFPPGGHHGRGEALDGPQGGRAHPVAQRGVLDEPQQAGGERVDVAGGTSRPEWPSMTTSRGPLGES